MSLANAVGAAEDWITAQLEAQETLNGVGVYVAAAGDDTPRPVANVHGPYFTLRHLGSHDQIYVGGVIAGSWIVIEVTAWDEGTSTEHLKPLVEAAHAALHGQRGATDDVIISGCTRQAEVVRYPVDDDRLYAQRGGEYRIRASAA